MMESEEDNVSILEASLEYFLNPLGVQKPSESNGHCIGVESIIYRQCPLCQRIVGPPDSIKSENQVHECPCSINGEASLSSSGEEKKWLFFSKRQWVALMTCILANFGCGACISLQAPFYPREAEKKGVTSSVYGLVFGAFSLTVFVVAPCFGKYVSVIGPKFMLNAGIFITSTCCMLFGLLDKVEHTNPFIALSFIIRIVEAIGEAAYTTASYTIIAQEFPDNIGLTLSYLRAAFGVGLNLGPTIGSFLYLANGYSLPFLVMGGTLFANAIVTAFIFWNQGSIKITQATKSKQSIFKILKVPSVFWTAAVTTSGAMSVGFLAATLEPRLRQFGIGTLYENLVFVIGGTVFALTSVIWGKLCEDIIHPRLLTAIGYLLVCVNYLFLGPAPFMPFDGAVWMAAMSLVFHGLGIGGELIPPYIDALRDSIDRGFPDNVDTYGLIAGLWSATFQLGSFIGPSLGGFLLQHLGFSLASVVILGCQVFMGIITFAFYLHHRFYSSCSTSGKTKPSENNETTPLLNSNSI